MWNNRYDNDQNSITSARTPVNRNKSVSIEGFSGNVFAEKIETSLRCVSPFYGGRKNIEYVNPNLMSNIFNNSDKQNIYTYSNIERIKKAKADSIKSDEIKQDHLAYKRKNDENYNNNILTHENFDKSLNDNKFNRGRKVIDHAKKVEGFDNREKQDVINTLELSKINIKVKERQKKTELASKSVILKQARNRSTKDEFINKTETASFPLNENKEDPLKQKVLEKYNRNLNLVTNSFQTYGKEKKSDQYYQKFVDESKTSLIEESKTRTSSVPSVSQYKASLDLQVLKKKIEKEKNEKMMKEYEINLIRKNNKILESEKKEQYIENQRKKFELSSMNKSMTFLKTRKTEIEKISKLKDEEMKIKRDLEEKERLINQDRENEMRKKQKLSENLKVQVRMNSKSKKLDKIMSELHDKEEVPIFCKNTKDKQAPNKRQIPKK